MRLRQQDISFNSIPFNQNFRRIVELFQPIYFLKLIDFLLSSQNTFRLTSHSDQIDKKTYHLALNTDF